jgi:hypothetical protein
MTGLPEFNFPAFNEAADLLRKVGYEVVNPAEKGIIDGWEWEDYLRYDLRQVLDVSGIATLPGWRRSRGARLEVHVATQLGMPVQTVKYWVNAAVGVAA